MVITSQPSPNPLWALDEAKVLPLTRVGQSKSRKLETESVWLVLLLKTWCLSLLFLKPSPIKASLKQRYWRQSQNKGMYTKYKCTVSKNGFEGQTHNCQTINIGDEGRKLRWIPNHLLTAVKPKMYACQSQIRLFFPHRSEDLIQWKFRLNIRLFCCF